MPSIAALVVQRPRSSRMSVSLRPNWSAKKVGLRPGSTTSERLFQTKKRKKFDIERIKFIKYKWRGRPDKKRLPYKDGGISVVYVHSYIHADQWLGLLYIKSICVWVNGSCLPISCIFCDLALHVIDKGQKHTVGMGTRPGFQKLDN